MPSDAFFAFPRLLVAALIPALLWACSPGDARSPADRAAARHGVADLVFFNGTIITLDPRMPEVRAIAIRQGRLIALGDPADIEPLTDAATRLQDLDGRTLMPGLLDARDPDAGRTPPPCIEPEPDALPASAPQGREAVPAMVESQQRASDGVVGFRYPSVTVDALRALLANERANPSVLHVRIGHWPACGARERLLLQQLMRELAASPAGEKLRIELDPEPAVVQPPLLPVPVDSMPDTVTPEGTDTGAAAAVVSVAREDPPEAPSSPWKVMAEVAASGADVSEALRSFTVDAAAALGLQQESGMLAAGRRADLVVLDRNPLQESPERIGATVVLQTWIGGGQVYEHAATTEP